MTLPKFADLQFIFLSCVCGLMESAEVENFERSKNSWKCGTGIIGPIWHCGKYTSEESSYNRFF